MMIRPDGRGVMTPLIDMRSRGQKIDDECVKGLRDLCYALLLNLGLTPADAVRVMDGRIDRSQVWRRQKDLAPLVARSGVFPLMQQLADGGACDGG